MPSISARRFHRGWLFGTGALLGVAAAFAVTSAVVPPGTSGCVDRDPCIEVTSPDRDRCRNPARVEPWPVGGSVDGASASVLRPDGSPPRGCLCYDDADDQIVQGLGACIGNREYEDPRST